MTSRGNGRPLALGALLVAIPAFRLIFKRSQPVLEDEFKLPTKKSWMRVCWGRRNLRRRLGAVWALSQPVDNGSGLGAFAGVRLRHGDARGDGALQVGLLLAAKLCFSWQLRQNLGTFF